MKPKKKRLWNVPPNIRQRVVTESRALHVTPEEYLVLITQVAESIRGAVLPDGIKDSTALQSILQNPLMLQMASALAGTLWKQMQQSQQNDSEPTLEAEVTDVPDTPASQTSPPVQQIPKDPPTPTPPPGMIVIDPITGQMIRLPRHVPF